jgi:hypothetical protein
MNTEIHIGKIIHDKLQDDGRSVLWLAKNMHCDRSVIYKIFQKQAIDTAVLCQISLIMNIDFFTYYSDYICNKKKDTEIV